MIFFSFLGLVACPGNYSNVNHIDGNRENNHVDNLEWVTQSMNTQHSYDTNDKRVGNHRGICHYSDLERTNLITMFPTLLHASEQLNLETSVILKILNEPNKNSPPYLGYEKVYVHNFDETGFEPIKDHPKYMIHRDSRIYSKKTKRFMKFQVVNGYYTLILDKPRLSVHRLIAIQFLPNPENKNMVNHKDGNKLNNHVDNLEWATDSENQIHAALNNSSRVRCVNQYSLTGEFIMQHRAIKSAYDLLGIVDKGNNIIKCCNHTFKSMYGWIWRYDGDETPIVPVVKPDAIKLTKLCIVQYTTDDKFVEKFTTYEAATAKLGLSKEELAQHCIDKSVYNHNGVDYKFMKNI